MKLGKFLTLILASSSLAVLAAGEVKPGSPRAIVKETQAQYVDPNPFADYGVAMQSTAENPLAVDWSREHDCELAAATEGAVLAACVANADAAAALLAQVKEAYAGDPLVLTQIAAVTQWTMLDDPWYCLFWDGPHAAGRKVWVAALKKAIAATKDDYVRIFCQQQLDLCK